MLVKAKQGFMFFAAAILVLQAPLFLFNGNVNAQELPPPVTAYSSISVRVNGVSAANLYNFTTNLENDSLWFPNVEETEVVTPGGIFGIGKVYKQISYFNDIPLESTVEVKSALPTFFYYIEGAGPVANYKALYTFQNASATDGVFTLTTEFTAPGITTEALTFLLTTAMQNILNHYQTTGTINMNFIYIP